MSLDHDTVTVVSKGSCQIDKAQELKQKTIVIKL